MFQITNFVYYTKAGPGYAQDFCLNFNYICSNLYIYCNLL